MEPCFRNTTYISEIPLYMYKDRVLLVIKKGEIFIKDKTKNNFLILRSRANIRYFIISKSISFHRNQGKRAKDVSLGEIESEILEIFIRIPGVALSLPPSRKLIRNCQNPSFTSVKSCHLPQHWSGTADMRALYSGHGRMSHGENDI